MKLFDLNCVRYLVPFRAAFTTAHGTLSHRTGVLVCIHTDTGVVGYGEIAPLPEHHGQSLNEVLAIWPHLARELRGRRIDDLLSFLEAQSADSHLPASLVCGLETALLDALGRASNLSVAELLTRPVHSDQGSEAVWPRQHVPVNAVISGSSIETTLAAAQAALAAGFTCLKLKVADTSPAALRRVAAVRATLGPVPRLRLDANEGWDFEQAREWLMRCADYDIEYIEQPLPAHDLAGMARLRRHSPIPLAADEALTNLSSARRILQMEAADVLILKPQLAGGPGICRRIIREAQEQGKSCVITSTLETGIGVASALHLAAASPEITLPCGLATLDLLASDLLQGSLSVDGGAMTLPVGPGLGIRPDLNALQRYGDPPELFRTLS